MPTFNIEHWCGSNLLLGSQAIEHNMETLLVPASFLSECYMKEYDFVSFNVAIGGDSREELVELELQSAIGGLTYYTMDSSMGLSYVALMSHRQGTSNTYTPIEVDPDEFPDFTSAPQDDVHSVHSSDGGHHDSDDAIVPGESIIPYLMERSRSNIINKLLHNIKQIHTVSELPRKYNGNVILEFPPTFGKIKMTDAMEQKYDAHMWSRPMTSNLQVGCTVRLSYCLGEMECHRVTCPYFLNNQKYNRVFFKGTLAKRCGLGVLADDGKSKVTCIFCKRVAYCTTTCQCLVYYVFPPQNRMTRLLIHVGEHKHEVPLGTSKKTLDKVKELVARVVKGDTNATPKKVQVTIAKELLYTSMLVKDGESHSGPIGDRELNSFLDEMCPLVQDERFRRVVAQERRNVMPSGFGYDAILDLKRRARYPFFHGSRFPGQGMPDERCYVFKMSTTGPASGVDLVNRMRVDGDADLNLAWVMFDHTHRVRDWVTMACHVYDPSSRELMTIATCEMKEEDERSQILFWDMLNNVMNENGYPNANFFGFMADEAQANWRAIRAVYNGDPQKVMEDRERSCLFHWKQSLVQHSRKYIRKQLQEEHIRLCEAWRGCATEDEARAYSHQIRRWWQEVARCDPSSIAALNSWMCWWGIRIAHWGCLMTSVERSVEMEACTPRTNLAECMHGSWMAAGGGVKKRISLYDACVVDMANALLQSAKQQAYLCGRHIGEGPSLENLIDRANSRNSPSVQQVANVVHSVAAGTPMYQTQHAVHGERETIQRKRHHTDHVSVEESHKPGFVMETRQKQPFGRPRKIDFGSSSMHSSHESGVREIKIHKTLWAIRRTPSKSKLKCLGLKDGKTKCGKPIQGSATCVVAPCFFSELKHPGPGGVRSQMMWFCNDNVTHTWHPTNSIVHIPELPKSWPVEEGTFITSSEIEMLQEGGFTFQKGSIETIGVTINDPTPTLQTREAESIETCMISRRRKMNWRSTISQAASRRITKAKTESISYLRETVLVSKKKSIFHVASASTPSVQYDVHVEQCPSCTCPDFTERETTQKAYLCCKHIYFVFINILGLNENEHMFIHQPILGTRDVEKALTQPRKIILF